MSEQQHEQRPRRLWADVPKEERLARAARQAACTQDPVMQRAIWTSAHEGIGVPSALEKVLKRMRGEK